MLIEFSVGNYKSFRDRVTFSMIAANIKSAHPELDESNTIKVNGKLSLLTSAAIYGKNASGKSNFGKALARMQSFVLKSVQFTTQDGGVPMLPFVLSTTTAHAPTTMEVIFIIDGIQYRYGFEADQYAIKAEWLYHVPHNRESILFERDEQSIIVKPAFKEGRRLEDKTRPETLFLTVVTQFNGTIAGKITDWFLRLRVMSGLEDSLFKVVTVDCLETGTHRESIVNFVKSLDVDIEDLVPPGPPKVEDLPDDVTPEVRQRLLNNWSEDIVTAHCVYNEKGEVEGHVGFELDDEESQGTRKLVALAGPLHLALEQGLILFIDEFDARLHTDMTRAIVQLFNSKDTNPKGAQLIFVTHDTNLLDNTLLRRDQIWFAEKDAYGATSLVSLAEFNERNDANFESRYLGGRYGGVPNLHGLSDAVKDSVQAVQQEIKEGEAAEAVPGG